MKWDEMSPRERDALVARKVFRWHFTDYHIKLKPYTTDISAAWEVVEEMQTKGFYIDVLSFSDHYVAVPHLSNGHEPVDDGVATTAPEAICKAALNAVGVDV